MLGYVVDETIRQQINQKDQNYWDAYLQEINGLLGASGNPVSLKDLENPDVIGKLNVLIIGWQSGEKISDNALRILDQWVSQGGILIGFGLQGLDHVFGIKTTSQLRQTPDDYTILAHCDVRDHALTRELHDMNFLEQKLLILSDVRLVDLDGAFELSRLFETTGRTINRPAISWHACGKGFAGYFAFDVAKTVWLLHQGRPLVGDAIKGNRYPRGADLSVVATNSRKVAYADELCFLIQNMIAQAPLPFIYQIPPEGDQIPDAILYYGGDEYAGPVEQSLRASDWMKQKGLGYHINTLHNHPMTEAEKKHILDNGHELSLYYGLHDEDDFTMKEEYYSELYDAYVKKFGIRPMTTVNKWLRWIGWSEPAKWMLKAGGKADNSFHSLPGAFEHPFANTSYFGFGCGTGYPFYFYDDYRGQNQKIEFMEQPIACYEVGHRGSIRDYETRAEFDVHLPVELAIKHHMVMNMFYHPAYIAYFPNCRRAIEEILRYIKDRGAKVLHWGNDAVTTWWLARSRSSVQNVNQDANTLTFDTACDYPNGMIVKLLLKKRMFRVAWGNFPATCQIKKEFAGDWLYIVVPAGKHRFTIVFE